MYKTDAAGNVANEFSEAGSSTRVDAAFMNEIMYEILNVLVAASITPVKGTRTQLRDAINSLIAAAGGVPDATTTVKGKVELATSAESITGTDAVRATTPAGVKAVVDLYAKLASAPTFTGQVAAPSFNTTSSRRWKTNIEHIDIHDAAMRLDAIELVHYQNINTETNHLGVIAEQLVDVGFAQFVQFDDEGQAVSVDYQSLFILSMAANRAITNNFEERLKLLEAAANYDQ